MPPEGAHLVEELRQQREGIKVLLLGRRISAALPPGVRLLSWQPKEPPVILTRHSVVTDVERFTTMTLEQLRVALEARRTCFFCRPEGKRGPIPTPEEIREHTRHSFRTSNWSVPDLVERLEAVGLALEVEGL